MRDRWSDAEAATFCQRYSKEGDDIALRVYTSRLIGAEASLVLHGGGNTSVKTTKTDILGRRIEVIAVKGSGWDLGDIEPQGLPCVDLAHCRSLRQLPSLRDEEMVNELRTHLLDFAAPTPSVETLLHAFLPHKFIDHSHADAILAIVDQPDAAAICKEIYGDRLALVDYIMPGFDLSKKAAEIYEASPSCEGLLLLKHGLFTFGATAQESYQRHIDAVSRAEAYIDARKRRPLTFDQGRLQALPADAASQILPLLRGAFAHESGQKWLLHTRKTEATEAWAASQEATLWSQKGPATPDHVIRTKPTALVLQDLPWNDKTALRGRIEDGFRDFSNAYHAYFVRQSERSGQAKKELDRLPRVLLIEGLGLVCAGQTTKAAVIAADVYEHTLEIIQDALAVGRYEPVFEEDIFAMEYWSLEQAKLGKSSPLPLQGQAVYLTGAASGIGLACAEAFGRAGASLFLVDRQTEALEEACKKLRSKGISVQSQSLDVTDAKAVEASFEAMIRAFGGVDIAISNAGAAFQAPIAECPQTTLEQSFALNFFAHQTVASKATQIFLAQKTGGCLLFNLSKAAIDPGPGFGPYAIPKAATVALMKQYALEYGAAGIRAAGVNADRIRTGLFPEEFVKQRAAARKIDPSEYFKANLLHEEVFASDVAKAFLDLALSPKTTAAILTVDGGNLAASLR